MRYLLDTNIVSHVIKGTSAVAQQRLQQVPMTALAISAVTLGEIQYGLAKCGHPPGLTKLIREFLLRVEVLPWDSHTATCYGDLRARCQAGGITLGALDLMIAAHAVAADCTLISNDRAFARIPGGLLLDNWIAS